MKNCTRWIFFLFDCLLSSWIWITFDFRAQNANVFWVFLHFFALFFVAEFFIEVFHWSFSPKFFTDSFRNEFIFFSFSLRLPLLPPSPPYPLFIQIKARRTDTEVYLQRIEFQPEFFFLSLCLVFFFCFIQFQFVHACAARPKIKNMEPKMMFFLLLAGLGLCMGRQYTHEDVRDKD